MNNDTFDRQQREAIDNWNRDRAAIDRARREHSPEHREPGSTGMKWAIAVVLAVAIGVPVFAYVQNMVIEMTKPTTEESVRSLCEVTNRLRESSGLRRIGCS